MREEDEGIFATNDNPFGLTTVHLAYSVSKPLDFERSDHVLLTMSAEVVVKVLHNATGQPNASLRLDAGSSFDDVAWTAVTLPVASRSIDFAILDSPVSPRSSGIGGALAKAQHLPLPLVFPCRPSRFRSPAPEVPRQLPDATVAGTRVRKQPRHVCTPWPSAGRSMLTLRRRRP